MIFVRDPLSIFGRDRLHMAEVRWFYRDATEWNAIIERLKLTACPHCKRVGTLIRHGLLFGFDEQSPRRKTVRARRVFCSNRNARPGCGRTISVWFAEKIRRLSLTTRGLWNFLQLAVTGTFVAAMRGFDCSLSDRTLQRVWRRFELAQSRIRTALMSRCPPPDQAPENSSRSAAAQVLAHLRDAFPGADSPITAFQQTTKTFFM
jgi:hypothetical protein